MKDSSKSIKYIEKTAFREFVSGLQKNFAVIAPRKIGEMVLFGELGENEQPLLDFTNSRQSPKEIFFPQTENLMEYEGVIDTRTPMLQKEPEKRRMILGIHPCDVASILILDKLFINDEFVDPYYKNLRDCTTILSYGCRNPRTTCFCTSLGGGPFQSDGSDGFITDVGDGYLIEGITDKGKEAIKSLEDAPAEMMKRKDAIAEKAQNLMPEKIDVIGIPEKLRGMFEHEIWREIAERCLGCGVCTYLCPTCHCFDIQDEAIGNKGRRIKNWDSCMFPLFTLHGSGHQPRELRFQRMRQRIMHKFNYYHENFGVIACSGCGRCVTECPVNIDVRETLKKIKETQ